LDPRHSTIPNKSGHLSRSPAPPVLPTTERASQVQLYLPAPSSSRIRCDRARPPVWDGGRPTSGQAPRLGRGSDAPEWVRQSDDVLAKDRWLSLHPTPCLLSPGVPWEHPSRRPRRMWFSWSTGFVTGTGVESVPW